MSSGIGDLLKKPESGLLILRVAAGATMIFSGIPKYLGGSAMLKAVGEAVSVYGIHGNALAWGFAAATVEVFGGVLVLLGVLSRLASLALVGVLVTALLSMNPQPTFESFGSWAHAAMMLATFLALLLTGPGEYSLSGGGKGGSKKPSEPRAGAK